jgi:DNA-binding protein
MCFKGYVIKGEGCYKIVGLNEKKIMTEKTTEAGTVEKRRTDENVIYVGHKPPMSYVLAVITEFQGSGSEEVIIKARGRSISTAVDTAEIVRNRFITDAKIKEIKISTESITNNEGRTSNVSSIEIYLTKKKHKKTDE